MHDDRRSLLIAALKAGALAKSTRRRKAWFLRERLTSLQRVTPTSRSMFVAFGFVFFAVCLLFRFPALVSALLEERRHRKLGCSEETADLIRLGEGCFYEIGRLFSLFGI